MYQTGYKGVKQLPARMPFNGGICRFYYILTEYLNGFPAIDYKTQYLSAEPTLQPGFAWFGPLVVPNTELGFSEELKRDDAGIYYEQKFTGFIPGDSGTARVTLENMPYGQYVIVAKMRAGGLFLITGNNEVGLDFNNKWDTGAGAGKTAGADFTFTGQSLHKALILPVFLGENVMPPAASGSGGSDGNSDIVSNETEIIYFNNVNIVNIQWSASRQLRFGQFPLIEVWYNDSLNGQGIHLANVPIYVDAQPPNMQTLTVNTGGGSGFIVIK